MKFLQACTDSSFLSLLVWSSLPFEWGFSPWTNIPTAHKLQTNSPQLKTLKSNNTHTRHTWHPCCTSYFSAPISHNHKTEQKLHKTQNRNQFSQIHTPMFLGLPLSPSLGNPNLGKNNKVGHLRRQIKQKNVTAPHENKHPIKFLLSTSLGIGKLRFTKLIISRAGNQQH
jgi:hypothetical protein